MQRAGSLTHFQALRASKAARPQPFPFPRPSRRTSLLPFAFFRHSFPGHTLPSGILSRFLFTSPSLPPPAPRSSPLPRRATTALTNFIRGTNVLATAPGLNEIILPWMRSPNYPRHHASHPHRPPSPPCIVPRIFLNFDPRNFLKMRKIIARPIGRKRRDMTPPDKSSRTPRGSPSNFLTRVRTFELRDALLPARFHVKLTGAMMLQLADNQGDRGVHSVYK